VDEEEKNEKFSDEEDDKSLLVHSDNMLKVSTGDSSFDDSIKMKKSSFDMKKFIHYKLEELLL
jgi:hypothetical protein